MNCFKSGAAFMLMLGTVSCANNGSSVVNGTLDGIVTTDEYYAAHASPTDPNYGMEGFVSSDTYYASRPPTLDTGRKVYDADCSKPVDPYGGNLHCK